MIGTGIASFPTNQSIQKPECTVTRTATKTVYGTDSHGNTYICEASATQTATAATCSQASDEAYGLALMWATILAQGCQGL
jgi:hypothetical protein